jgi:outer membrane protein W
LLDWLVSIYFAKDNDLNKPPMKKTLLALILACGAFSVQAQDAMRIGVKGSFNSTWMFNNNVSDVGPSLDYASSFGSSFGAQFIYNWSESYGVDVELLYTGFNQKYDLNIGTEKDPLNFVVEDNIKYLDIPVLFRMSSPKGPYFEIGPQASLLMGAKESFTGETTSAADYSDRDFKDDFKGFGLSGILGFGVDIKLDDNLFLNTGLRFGYTFTDATTEYTETELDAKSSTNPSGVSLNAGFNHYSTEVDKNKQPIFDYQKSSRAWGGLNLGLQFQF